MHIRHRPAKYFLLFCGFPQGHNGNSAVQHQNTHMLPDARESQKQELVSVPPPHTAWLQNMQTDRASLDSSVCVPACDASPQLQTNSVNSARYSSCGLSVCKLCNYHIDTCIYTQLCLLFQQNSYSAARVTVTHKDTTHLPCMSLQVIKTRRLWLFDPIHTSWIKPWKKGGAWSNNLIEETHDGLISYLISKEEQPALPPGTAKWVIG